jgi:broad specificity phosphatase PhoE
MRHGESLANEKDILASRQDFHLSPRGIADVNNIAKEFLEKIGPVNGIISSPLSRAKETAEPFCRLMNKEIEVNEYITEQELGVYSGMTYAQLENAPGYEHERTKRWNWIPNGGESRTP